ELVDLNHRIVERLRLLQHIRAHADMLEFRIGERVTFQPDGRGPVQGMLTRYNRKSVTVVTDHGHRWTGFTHEVPEVEFYACLGNCKSRLTLRGAVVSKPRGVIAGRVQLPGRPHA